MFCEITKPLGYGLENLAAKYGNIYENLDKMVDLNRESYVLVE